MLASTVYRCCPSLSNFLFINLSTRTLKSRSFFCVRKSSSTSNTSSPKNMTTNSSKNPSIMGPNMCRPSDFERWILVWMKKYPKGQVPEYVTHRSFYTLLKGMLEQSSQATATAYKNLTLTVFCGKLEAQFEKVTPQPQSSQTKEQNALSPILIRVEQMYQTKSRARIKAANRMLVVCALAFLGTVLFGKSLREKGDSIDKRNREWHKKINEEYHSKQKAES